MKLKNKTHKICPRCGNKCLLSQNTCEECGLIFSRLQYASNKLAKQKILRCDRDFIIYTNQYPSDVSWIKLFLYAIFFGLFGVHYYYVGKYVKGALMTASFIYLVFCAVFNDQLYNMLEAFGYIPIGIATFAWLYSIASIGLKKFKVPVIVQMPQGEEK